MSFGTRQVRWSLAALALGVALAGPQALGVARADADAQGSRTTTSAESGSVSRGAHAARGTTGVRARGTQVGVRARGTQAGAAAPRPAPTPVRASSGHASAVGLPPPPDLTYNSTIATPYGNLGQWMINKDNRIADWIGTPQPVDGSLKIVLEGINVVMVDTASGNATQSVRNLNAWMSRAGFGASAISSTGYKGAFGPSPGSVILGQQPTGASQAFRDSFFLFANSHGRAFGPYPNPNGPGFVWTAALSEENWTITNPLTHGHESFDTAREKLRNGMIAAGAGDLGELFMDNVYNVGDYSTGDADGFAAVLELNSVLKSATTPRGNAVGTKS